MNIPDEEVSVFIADVLERSTAYIGLRRQVPSPNEGGEVMFLTIHSELGAGNRHLAYSFPSRYVYLHVRLEDEFHYFHRPTATTAQLRNELLAKVCAVYPATR